MPTVGEIAFPEWAVTVLLAVTIAVALLMASSNALAKRLGPWSIAIAALTTWASMSVLVAVLGGVLLVLWLYDRGIPGNRRRSRWMWALAGLTALLAIATGLTEFR